jgi:cytochrome P450
VTIMGTTDTLSAPSIDINLYDPALVDDPWPTLAVIRDMGDVVWNEHGYWMTARDRICRQAFSHYTDLGHEGLVESFFGSDAFITINDRPRHNALRDVWIAAFGHNGVEKLVPVVRQIIAGMLEPIMADLRSGQSSDLFASLCRPLPAHVIAHMMGVSGEMTATVIKWADAMAGATVGGFPIDYANDPYWLASEMAKAELGAFLFDQLDYRRRHPGDDLISAMVGSEVGAGLSDEAKMVNVRQLLFAGNETTSNWLGHIVVTFGTFPNEWEALRQKRDLVPAAVEEVLRWQGVTQVMMRSVGKDGATIAGQHMAPGDEVVMLLGAAGRDPERFERPDEFDIRREKRSHLAFGYGLHTCLGAILARMEAVEVANALLDRIPAYRMAKPVSYHNFSLRGPVSTWVELGGT